jgi:hypothetical protein
MGNIEIGVEIRKIGPSPGFTGCGGVPIREGPIKDAQDTAGLGTKGPFLFPRGSARSRHMGQSYIKYIHYLLHVMENCKPGRNLLRSAFVLLYLVSCVTNPNLPRFSPVYVTDRAKYTLLPAAGIEAPLDGPQQISGSWGEREFVMNAWVKADETGIHMALFNSLGDGMGEFSFTDGGVSFQSPVFPPALKGEYLAADFQFCFYRTEVLSEALKECGLDLELENREDENGDLIEIRRITEAAGVPPGKGPSPDAAGKKIIIEIEKTKTLVRYTNLLRGYSYTLGGEF